MCPTLRVTCLAKARAHASGHLDPAAAPRVVGVDRTETSGCPKALGAARRGAAVAVSARDRRRDQRSRDRAGDAGQAGARRLHDAADRRHRRRSSPTSRRRSCACCRPKAMPRLHGLRHRADLRRVARPCAARLSADVDEGERNTLLSRRFPGGSLKIVAAKAPRNLRRHTARVLIVDEADACEIGAEGNPIRLAERRTLSFRKPQDHHRLDAAVRGHDPRAARLCRDRDARVFEVPCPECGGFTEIMWQHIEWQDGRPGHRRLPLPALQGADRRAAQGRDGRRRALARDAARGAAAMPASGSTRWCRCLANASWAQAGGRIRRRERRSRPNCKPSSTRSWRKAGARPAPRSTRARLQARAEPFGLDAIPAEVLVRHRRRRRAGRPARNHHRRLDARGRMPRARPCRHLGHARRRRHGLNWTSF